MKKLSASTSSGTSANNASVVSITDKCGTLFSTIANYNGETYSYAGQSLSVPAVIRTDKDGKLVWGAPFVPVSANIPDLINSVTDKDLNTYTLFRYDDGLSVAGLTIAAPVANSYAVVKLDKAGKGVWVVSVQSPIAFFYLTKVDEADNFVFIAGSTDSDLTIGSTTLSVSTTFGTSFYAKLKKSDGSVVWAKALNGNNDFAQTLSNNCRGESYVTGGYESSVTFGATTLTATTVHTDGYATTYLAKANDKGEWVWAKSVQLANSNAYTFGTNLVAGKCANYLSTYYAGTVVLDSKITLNGQVSQDYDNVKYSNNMYVSSFDAAGAYNWVADIGVEKATSNRGIFSALTVLRSVVDAADNVYVTVLTKNLNGKLTITHVAKDGKRSKQFVKPFTEAGTSLLLLSFDKCGRLRFAKVNSLPNVVSNIDVEGYAIEIGAFLAALDVCGHEIVIGGDFFSTLKFVCKSATSTSANDIYVARLCQTSRRC